MMNGTSVPNFNRIPLDSNNPLGLSLLGDNLYWIDISPQGAIVKRVSRSGGPVISVSMAPLQISIIGGMEVVHPSKQPDGKQTKHLAGP